MTKWHRFLQSPEWLAARRAVFKRDGAICACCSRTRFDGVSLEVDHIKPRWDYPDLALDMTNLQILCHDCNKSKGRQVIDYRDYEPSI